MNELEESERYFRQLADMVPVKISNALPNGDATYFNKQWLDYSHMTFEELRNFGYHHLIHPDEIELFQSGLADAVDKGQPFEMTMRFLDAEGNYRWHLNIASPILNEYGKVTMWVGSTTDIQRIKEEEHRKTDFIGMVSHELKTPLTSLTGYLQMLQSRMGNTENALFTRALDKAVSQVKKMSNMISSFLNVSRLESAKIHLEKERFDITALITEMEEEAHTTIHTHEIVFLPVEATAIVADREKIGQVINNLIGNAVKYSHHRTRIEVSCKTTGDHVQVCVRDQGFGIKPENLKRLFELYYRVEGTQMKQISGFGIGLFLCAEIIKLHGGKIWAESEPGVGSAFYFTLPLVQL